MSNQFAYIMAPKEENELKIIQRACQVTCDVFNKYLKDQIMEIIDAEKVLWCCTSYVSCALVSCRVCCQVTGMR